MRLRGKPPFEKGGLPRTPSPENFLRDTGEDACISSVFCENHLPYARRAVLQYAPTPERALLYLRVARIAKRADAIRPCESQRTSIQTYDTGFMTS